MHDVEQKITTYLQKHFNEKGKKDFTFKIKKLPFSFDNRLIGKVLGGSIASKTTKREVGKNKC
jgi:hypothetical protein